MSSRATSNPDLRRVVAVPVFLYGPLITGASIDGY